MTKYNFLFKQQVIEFYLQNGKNSSLTRRHFQLAETTLERWINQFNHSGINGLALLGKKRNYSPEFKLNVIQAVKNGKFSAEAACLHFGIANSGIVSQWLQAFEKQGINGLIPKPKGRPTMKLQYPKMPPKPKTREEELELENLRLRAENAILKNMQWLGLKGKCKTQKYRSYQGEVGHIADNLLQRDFTATQPNEKWTTYITEFKCAEGKLYLSPIKDLFNNEIIAYDLARSPNFEQITRMMKQAVARLEGAKPILHSDQGWQYQMIGYQNILRENGIQQSMSRKGNCLDNSAMESFFGRLKTECYYGKRFETFEQLEKTIHEYIHYYNHERIQGKLKGLSPVNYRTQSLN